MEVAESQSPHLIATYSSVHVGIWVSLASELAPNSSPVPAGNTKCVQQCLDPNLPVRILGAIRAGDEFGARLGYGYAY